MSTRDRIIGEAMRLFWEKGYASTSIADILKAADANAGSLYHFFPGKQDLLIAVLDAYQAGIRPMLLDPAWAGIDDPVERIFALLAKYRQLLVDTECSYGCPIGYLALELHEPDPPVRVRIAANFDGWVAAIEECILAARDRFPESTDPRRLAHFVLTTMEGAVMQARTYRNIETFDHSIEELRRYFDTLQQSARPPRTKGRKR
jgi:TetR/AcrR family transcriptional regulator, transcriptional repressor for nem operon